MTKTVIEDDVQLAPEKIFSLYLTCEEIGSADEKLALLEAAFNKVQKSWADLRDRLTRAKAARGELVRPQDVASNGLIWQRDRAFMVSIVKIEAAQKKLHQDLDQLAAADRAVRTGCNCAGDMPMLIANNLRCSYELYELAAVLYLEAASFVAEVKASAFNRARTGVEHLRHVTPGFNRGWVIKFRSLEGEGPAKYTLFGDVVCDQPPSGPRMSNWDIKRALEFVGAAQFAKGEGWVAVYDPARDHTGPKHFFRNGKSLKESSSQA